jgi:hypothetical protein
MNSFAFRRRIARWPRLAGFLRTALGVSALGTMLVLSACSTATFGQGATEFYQAQAVADSR